jgi:NAD(P)-dependent dehydrogenase (short-subunit alcohol dehydrogenase family)
MGGTSSVQSFVTSLPRQDGKISVCTGANSGIGLEACVQLASLGSTVVLCCRNAQKAETARQDVIKRGQTTEDKVKVVQLDLASLDNVRGFRSRLEQAFGGTLPTIDHLILNAGVMALNKRESSPEGSEMQMATNNFGHFLFAASLIDLVIRAPTARIIAVSSGAHKIVSGISFDDVDHVKHYEKWRVYGESKLGNLLFINHLQKLLHEKNIHHVLAIGVHPGFSATNLQDHTSFSLISKLIAQGAEMGATPTTMACCHPAAKPADYCGPWFFDYVGTPTFGRSETSAARNVQIQKKFWELCEMKTSANFVSKL